MKDRNERQRRLKERLTHTWDAFFTRFGRFTEIQLQSSDALLAGANCVLASATASGKTEAALVPLLEHHVQNRRKPTGLSILYLAPTRALARDLALRLAPPLERLAVTMRVKTGDEPALKTARPPELLLTTPESLDSLLAGSPRLLKDVRALVIDELHLFDNTVRGDQLRILLNRLRRLKRYAFGRGDIDREEIQYCALSATIAEPAVAAARYFPDPVVVEVVGQRAIDAELIEMREGEDLGRCIASLRRRGGRKALAFCPSRAECEQWAYRIRSGSPFGDNVFVHHAGLTAGVRRSVEKRFAHAEAAICFATSTLELGIDIGDVDLVILIGAPDDERAFLQRIGRGNRRSARTAVVCCARNELERALFQIFLRPGSSVGVSEPYFFRPSVIVQQLCSYIKQTRLGEIDPESSFELFAGTDGTPLVSRGVYNRIVEHLTAKEYFVAAPGGALRPGPVWRELYEQRAIYTNLLDIRASLVEVIAEETGRKIGEIEHGVPRGEGFLFGGQARRAVRRVGRKLMVRTDDTDAVAAAPRGYTPQRTLSAAMARAVAAELGMPQPADPATLGMLIESGETEEGETAPTEKTWLFHYAGRPAGQILGDLLEARFRLYVESCDDLCVVIRGKVPPGVLDFTVGDVRAMLGRRWQHLEGAYSLGRFQNQLPLDVRRASVIEAFDPAGFLRAFCGRRLAEIKPNEPI